MSYNIRSLDKYFFEKFCHVRIKIINILGKKILQNLV